TEIPALDVHGALLTLPRVRRTEGDLDLLGPTLANQKVIVLPYVLPDRLVHLVTRDPHRLAVDDPRQGNHCHLGGPAADVDDQIAARLLNRQPGPHRRRDRLLHEIHGAGPGGPRGVADRPPVALLDGRRTPAYSPCPGRSRGHPSIARPTA